MSSETKLIKNTEIFYSPRPNSGGGQAEIAWVIPVGSPSPVLAGYATWDAAEAPAKMLDYEEVILVLEGSFGVELQDGTTLEGKSGDILHIQKGTTVKYFGHKARLFFAITPPGGSHIAAQVVDASRD